MNDELLEDYFMLLGKHRDRIVIEIPVEKILRTGFPNQSSQRNDNYI